MTKYEIWLVNPDGTLSHVGEADGHSHEQALRKIIEGAATNSAAEQRYMLAPSRSVKYLQPRARVQKVTYEMAEFEFNGAVETQVEEPGPAPEEVDA